LDLANRWSQCKWDGTGNVINENSSPPSISTGEATGRAHASTARATIKWQPIQQVLVRGTWSQGFRTPSISELFSGSATGFPTVNDPCVNPVAPLASLPSRYACPANASQPDAQIATTGGGNAHLSPEKALTRSAGIVYSPRWAPGLDVSADYYKIEVDDIIGSLGPQYYLNACYYGADTSACGHIVRPGNAINKIFALTTNSGSFKTNGWDVNLRYRFPTTPVGNFTFRMQATFVKEAVSCSAATKVSSNGTFLPNCVDAAGSIDSPNRIPKHRYNISLNWSRGPWSAFWKMDVIGPMYETCSNSSLHSVYGVSYTNSSNWCSQPNKVSAAYYGKSVGLHRLGTTIYHDIQGSYTVNAWNTTFSVGINNVFNKLPPVSYTAFANSYSPYFYRTPGRFVYGRISVRF